MTTWHPHDDWPMPVAPCPFCGAGPAGFIQNAGFSGLEVLDLFRGVIVNCGTCGARGSYEVSAAEAVAAWNRRTPAPDPRDEEISRLREVIAEVRFALDTGAVSFGETINYQPQLIMSLINKLEGRAALKEPTNG